MNTQLFYLSFLNRTSTFGVDLSDGTQEPLSSVSGVQADAAGLNVTGGSQNEANQAVFDHISYR
jgi:hypothetical protein